MSKVKKSKPENIKNYFYLLNKSKYELFEPPVDNDHELIEKIKKSYYDQNEETFIDDIIFCRLENLCRFIKFLIISFT